MAPLRGVEAWGGRVAAVRSWLGRDGKVCLVCVESSDGVRGWGQLGNKDADLSEELLHRRVAPAVVGARMNDPARLQELVLGFELNYKCMGVQLSKAMAGLDSAVWDACGKAARRPVSELARAALPGASAGRLRPFPAYASSISRAVAPEALAGQLARLQRLFGFSAFKIKIGQRMQGLRGGTPEERAQDQWDGRSEAVVAAARAALGPGASLAVDCNGAFPDMRDDPGPARAACALVRAHGLAFLEEPFFWCRYEAYRALAEAEPGVVLAGGEQEFRMDVWESVPPFAIFQPDLGYCGGPTNAVRIAQIAAANGRRFVPHSPQGDLHLVFALHLACGLADEATDHIEVACVGDGIVQVPLEPTGPGRGVFHSPIFSTPLVVSGGRLALDGAADAAGWGVEVRPEWLSAARERVFDAAAAAKLRSGL